MTFFLIFRNLFSTHCDIQITINSDELAPSDTHPAPKPHPTPTPHPAPTDVVSERVGVPEWGGVSEQDVYLKGRVRLN